MKESAGLPQKDPSLTKSLLKTLQVLDQFAHSEEMGIKELSIGTGLPASTVQRIVNTLESRNYLKQNPDTYKYRLGMAFFGISSHYSSSRDWIDIAKLHMEEMVRYHGETVSLAILQGSFVTCLAKVESSHILRPQLPLGVPFPACCTALGRSMLAFQKNIDMEELLSHIQSPTSRTITHPEQLARELEKVRQSGCAMEDEEFHPGLFCMAAPIRDAGGHVMAAISVTIPKSRLDITVIPTLVNDILSTASHISGNGKDFFHFEHKRVW